MPPKPKADQVEDATYEEVRKWVRRRLDEGVPVKDLRAVAHAHDRRRDGNTSAVDAIRHVTG